MTAEKSPIKDAAYDLFTRMSEISEDVLEDLWFSQHEDYLEFADNCTAEELFAWQEPFFRQVMTEFSALCIKRAQGDTP